MLLYLITIPLTPENFKKFTQEQNIPSVLRISIHIAQRRSLVRGKVTSNDVQT